MDIRDLDKGVWKKEGVGKLEEGVCYHGIMAFERV